MDEYRENVKKVQKAMNQDAAFIQSNPYLAQRVLNAANAERIGKDGIVVKKKMSIGFVAALILMLFTVTALAIGLTNYFGGFAALENTYGEYEQWPSNARVELVKLMSDCEVLSEEEANLWRTAHESERQEVADEVLAMHFEGMTYIDTYNAMARELGPIEMWSDENRALYTSILQQYGKYGMDWPIYVVPSDTDITRNEAIDIAKKSVLAMFSLEEDQLNAMSVDAIFSMDPYNTVGAPSDEPFWEINFGYGLAYRIYMTRTGEMLGVSGPKTEFYPWNCEIDAGAKAAEVSADCVSTDIAIAEARSALGEIMNVPYTDLDFMEATAKLIYCDLYCNGEEPVWLITWSNHGEVKWNVLLGFDGSYIDAEPAGKLFDSVNRQYETLADIWRKRCSELGMTEDFMNSKGNYYYAWTLEEKTAFSTVWGPIVNEYALNHPYFEGKGSGVWEWTRNINGMPDSKAITQDDAVGIALMVIKEHFGDELNADDVYVFYIVTNPEQPEWRIASATRFVTIDAHTGKVKSVENNRTNDGGVVTISDFLQK